MIPELDSVVRFEGEETLAELVGGWTTRSGRAFRDRLA